MLTLFGSRAEGDEAGAGAAAAAAAGPSSGTAGGGDDDETAATAAIAAASLPGSKSAHAAAHHHELNHHSHHSHQHRHDSHGVGISRATPPAAAAAGPLSSSLRPPPSPAAAVAAAAGAAGANGAPAATPSTDGDSDTCVDGGSLSEAGAAAAAATAAAATSNNPAAAAAAAAVAAASAAAASVPHASAAAAVAAAATATAAAAAAATSAAGAAVENRNNRDAVIRQSRGGGASIVEEEQEAGFEEDSKAEIAAATDTEDDDDDDAEEDEEECDDEFVEFDPYAFIKALPPLDARLPPSALGIDIGIDESEICFSPSRGGGGGSGSSDDDDGGGGVDEGDATEKQDLNSSSRRQQKRRRRLRTLGDVLRARPPLLPPVRSTRAAAARPTLVLDLDETLVHSTLGPGPVALTSPDSSSGIAGVGGRRGQPPAPGAVSRFSFDVSLAGRTHAVHVRTRPHLLPFLERCSRLFEVVVFTASQKVYAEQLLDVIDPARRLIRHRVFRDSCVVFEGNYLKDLSALGRALARVVIVDNSPQAFGFQLDNGIPIESWYDDDRDDELRRLLPLLESLAVSDDVRPLLASAFQLRKLVERAPSLAPACFLA